MCGIAGILSFHPSARPVDREELLRIREAMANRGPDGAGLWLDPGQRIGLAHRRLSIIDLSENGAQPMLSRDGRLAITFNGEIYNYRELRRDLEQKGCRFQSNSDTEVLLHLYADLGNAMFDRLRGMYAFAIWDDAMKSLLLARDPFGIKPLYFSNDGKTLRFASQVKALLKGRAIDMAPDAAGHVGFFVWGSVPEPYTLYRDIRTLPAGTHMVVTRDGPGTPHAHFEIGQEIQLCAAETRSMTREDMRNRLRSALLSSVSSHMVADVPVGVFLSSGLDSSTITALATEVEGTNLNTVTLGFREFANSQNDETLLASAVANHYGTRHQTVWCSKAEFQDDLQAILNVMDQPSIDGVNTFFVSKAAASAGMKVALSGIGGDELFRGYQTFTSIPLLTKLLRFAPLSTRLGGIFRKVIGPVARAFSSPKYSSVLEYGSSIEGAYLLYRSLYLPWELEDFLDEDTVRDGWSELNEFSRLQEATLDIEGERLKVFTLEASRYMRNQLLRDADWAGMAHSLEIRTPLVDVQLFRDILPLFIGPFAPGKRDMASTPARSLPVQVLARPKTGFSIPVRDWSRQNPQSRPSEHGLRGWAKSVNPPLPKKKRFLALVTDGFGGHGGIAKFNRDLLTALCSYDQTREVVAIPRLMRNQAPYLPDKLVWVTTGIDSKLKFTLSVLRFLSRGRGFDSIICGHINLLPLAWLFSATTGRPLLLVLHGIDAWKPTTSWAANKLVRRVDGFLSVSRLTFDRFRAWSHADHNKVHLLPNCVDLSTFEPREKSTMLMNRYQIDGRKVIMTLGRLAPAERFKGFDEVLDAMPELLQKEPNLIYMVAGDGADRERLQQKAVALGIAGNVVFTGFVPEASKVDHFNLADAYVMPSRGEGFGIVFLEAMACGIPVVGSTLDGSAEALCNGKLGILVDPRDREDLISGIFAALGREKVLPNGLDYFSYQNFERRCHAILRQMSTS